MGSAFEGADFSEMVEGGGVWIDEVRHKAFIEVDEQGTEVAAATSVAVKQWSAMPSEFYMLVDHPFFFAIRDNKTRLILFMGSVANP